MSYAPVSGLKKKAASTGVPVRSVSEHVSQKLPVEPAPARFGHGLRRLVEGHGDTETRRDVVEGDELTQTGEAHARRTLEGAVGLIDVGDASRRVVEAHSEVERDPIVQSPVVLDEPGEAAGLRVHGVGLAEQRVVGAVVVVVDDVVEVGLRRDGVRPLHLDSELEVVRAREVVGVVGHGGGDLGLVLVALPGIEAVDVERSGVEVVATRGGGVAGERILADPGCRSRHPSPRGASPS